MRWAAIEGYPGYEVSDTGLVRSLDRTVIQNFKDKPPMERRLKGKVLSMAKFRNGYLKVTLCPDLKMKLVHRLVAVAFIPGDQTLQVNHKNGVRDDNRAVNLEWLSCSENHKHSYRELDRPLHTKAKAVLLVKDGISKEFESEWAAARHLGVCQASIRSAALRIHKCRGHEVFHV